MLMVLSKKGIGMFFAVIALCVCLGGTAYRICYSRRTFLPTESKIVIVDAGHGAPDGGAIGSAGIPEKDLNLAVAKKLQQFLEQGGTNVLLTRSDDNGIYDISQSIKSKKKTDMINREKIMDESGADAFISIHMNKFSDSQYSGPQVFYSKNDERSEVLANQVQENLNEALLPESPRNIKKADSNIYLLKQAHLPAILVECGFLSNEEEQKKLIDDDYQKQIAWAIYCGVIKYFNEE